MAARGFRADIDDAVRGLKRGRVVVLQEIDKSLRRGANEVARVARRDAAKAFSTLTNSIRALRERPLRWAVAPGVAYGGYVEEGRGPGGMPPVQSILDWIRVRRIQPRDPETTEGQLAFLIARKIAAQGIEPQPYLEPSLESKRARLERLVMLGTERGIRKAGLA